MRPYPLTVLAGGINRLRVKGGAAANMLYDLQNAYVTNAGSVAPREGTIRTVTLDSTSIGLAAANGNFNIFSSAFSTATLATGFVLNVLSDPNDRTQAPVKIWFAKPFMGFEYVVAQFKNGDIWHYWLQNNGTWTSTTDYTSASIVLPPVPNGIAYQGVRDFPPQPLWAPDTAVTLGEYVEPNTPTGFAYQAVAIAGQPVGVLYHFDDTPGALSFLDSNGYGNNAISSGGAITTTNPVKFGSDALKLNGTTAYTYTPIVTNGPMDIGVGDFTIECWIYPATLSNSGAAFSIGTASTTPIEFNLQNIGGVQCNVFTGVSGGGSSTLATNTWNHIALSCSGTTGYIFVNGVTLGGGNGVFSVPSAGRNPLTGAHLAIGAVVTGSASQFTTASFDEFRITKGQALYTTGFTPPLAAFLSTSSTPTYTGAVEPVWPTVAGGILQEFGDFDGSSTDAGTTQGNSVYSTAAALGPNLTDRYGDSATIANAGIFATSNTLSTLTLASTKITTWKAGNTYPPGSVVIPTSTQGAFTNAIPNGDFEGGSGAGGWTFTDPGGVTQWAYDSTLPYQGTEDITFPGGSGVGSDGAYATMTSYSLVTPGQSVTATAYLDPNNSGANLELWLQINWYDNTDTLISFTRSAAQEGGGYRQVGVTGSAPATAAHVRVAIRAGSGTNSRNAGFADLVTWNLATPAPVTNFLFEAVQPNSGISAATQPTWPTVLGNEVTDGTVTWQAIGTSIITWQAIPLMQSGLTAPTFPTTIGNAVHDFSTYSNINGYITTFTSMSWEAIDRHVLDTNCPQQIPTALGASHVFNGDNDIANYSAAVNPIDWSSTNNAGYLPTGLNNYGDNPIAVLALYRSNLMVFNAGGYQMWQIDPDPQNMALLDAQPIGSIWPQAAQSVANDLLFLTEVGVRNLGTVGPTANMAVGNTGQPIDPLVLAQLQSGLYTGTANPLSIYYPGRGQYWLFFGAQAFVLTINGTAGTKSWSRYLFPATITDATLNGGSLYLRTATNLVWQVSPAAIGVDDANTLTTLATPVAWNGLLQWPYLDMGALGINKMLIGVDIVGEGSCNIQLAYNQSDKSTFNDSATFTTSTGVTAPFFVVLDDTVPGEPLPIPINAASYSLILTFPGNVTTANAWTWQAANLYVQPQSGAGATG